MKKISITLLALLFSTLIYPQAWTKVSNVPGFGREAAISFVINDKVYIGGGVDSLVSVINDFYEYDPATNIWTQKANMPDNMCASSCFTLNGMGYAVCGENRQSVTKSVYQYDPIADRWNTKSLFPGTARMDPVGFSIGDTGYVYGGFVGGSEVNDLWAYNPGNDTWTQKTSMPSNGRSSATGFVLNGIAYIGLGEYNSSANYPSDIGAYNPATNSWSVIAQFPGHLRAGAIGFTIGNFGYVGFGGYVNAGSFVATNDIYQYNPANNTWTAAGAFPGPGRGNSVCQSVGNIIYAGTGQNTRYLTDWWRYIYHVNISMSPGQAVCNGSHLIFDPVESGGIAPITYSWSSTGDSLSCYNCQHPSVTLTQNSTYILSVKDANNTLATDTVSYTVSANQNAVQASLTNTNISCQSPTDTTQAVVTNGVAPFLFQWGDGTSITDISPTTHLFSQAGVYVFSVTDSSGCVTSIMDTILNTGVAISLAQAVTPICLYDSSGKIFVHVTGGTPPYTYHWTTGSTTDSTTHIPAGDYSVTVTDAGSCSTEFLYQLNTNNDVWNYYIYLDPTGPNCSNNGTITTNVYGGNPPYSFLWSDSATTQNIQHLSAGAYSVTVTDSSGCPRKAGANLNFNCASIISGYIFVDTNNNCIFDAGESPIPLTSVSAFANGYYYYGFTDWSGRYAIVVPDTGTYTMQAQSWDGFCANISLCGNTDQTVTIAHLGDSSLHSNFASSVSTGFDLTIHPGWTSADPGFQKEYWVMPFNQSILPYNGPAVVTFAFDSNLIYEYSLPPLPVYNSIAHTLTWTVDSLPNPFWNWDHVRFENFFKVPTTLTLGYLLQSDFYITPTVGDCDSSNNHLHFSETVIGSHDPNEKSVVPANDISPDDSILTYTIHFQNTGTDSTWFITVQDTLSPYLDPASVRNIASSHPYTDFTIEGKGTLTWIFDPLRLVDSVTNPRGSQGFITFSVKKKKNLPLNTTIRNTAYIYFDYYNAVVTNTVSDTVAIITPPGIRTSAITGSPFCAGESVNVPFATSGNFVTGNVFTAQLSDANGGFSGPVSIGATTATTGGNINATIPSNTPGGTGYRIRVVSNSPVVTGTNNGSNITINAKATLLVTIHPDTICSGNSTLLTVTGSSGTVQWQSSPTGSNFTDINGANSASYNTPPQSQTTDFRLVARNGHCSDTSASLTLLVNPLPVPPTLSTHDSVICSSDSSMIQTSGTYSSYLWNNGSTTNYTYAKQAGGYWVTVTNANGCMVVSGHQDISLYPVSSVSIVVQGDTLSSFGAVSYHWYRDGSPISNATSNVYVTHQQGSYSVEVTDTNGCTIMSSPVSVTGITELAEQRISLYPNPSTGSWQLIVGIELIESNLEVYDDNGRLVWKSEIRSQKSEIQPDVAKGIYWLRISSPNVNIIRKLVRM